MAEPHVQTFCIFSTGKALSAALGDSTSANLRWRSVAFSSSRFLLSLTITAMFSSAGPLVPTQCQS